jgi:hypothetical protein
MESVLRENGKTNVLSGAVEEAQMDSTPNKPLRTVNENIEKCEIQLEECGADIDEIFIKLYGEPGQPISGIKQREILNKENAKRKRAEKMPSECTDDGKPVENSGKATCEMVDEDIIEQDSVIFEEAEMNLDAVFEDLESSENVETTTNWFGNFFPCSIV